MIFCTKNMVTDDHSGSVTLSLFLDILGLKAGLEQHEDALKEQERAQGEAVAATVLNARHFRDILPEVDEYGAGRDVEYGAAQGEESVLKEVH